MSEPLITRYRPKSFDEVIGNTVAVKGLEEAIKSTKPHAFLFTGPSGIGKTTLARIIALQLNASIVEIDASTNNGVEDSRRLSEFAHLRPVTEEPNVLYIIDECHALSRDAWKPLLKLLEEPPSFAYFALCTTDPQKIPDTIITRCYPVALKRAKPTDIEDLLQIVCELEKWNVSNDVFQAIVQAADGSLRRALVTLEAGHACQNREELSTIIAGIDSDTNPAIELARFLIKGGRSWKQISSIMERIEDPEAAIRSMSSYIAGTLTKREEPEAQEIYRMLRAFTDIGSYWDKKVLLYTAIGKILWGQVPF